MGTLERTFRNESALNGVRNLLGLVGHRATGRLNAASHGWSQGVLPLGSRIVGSQRIRVGSGFFARGPVWFEAVNEYAGISHDSQITLGANVNASDRLHISAVGRIEIGYGCLFGSGVLISDNSHGSYGELEATADSPSIPPTNRSLSTKGGIVIGDRCWLGENVVVLSGVVIGEGTVVAANSVVTRSLPANCVAAGSPARVVREFDPVLGAWLRAAPNG